MKPKLTAEERHARYVAYHQKYREERREQLAARARADYAAKKERLGKEALAEKARAYRKANPKKHREYERRRPNQAERAKAAVVRSIKWAKEHPDRIKESRKRYYARHREKVIAKTMRHHWANRDEQLRKARRNALKRVYGLTPEEYDSLGNACQICGITEDPNGKRLAVDHVKGTKIIRGLLCGACNGGIASLRHDIAVLQKAIDYLIRTTATPAFNKTC